MTFDEWWQDNGMIISAEYHAAKQIWQTAIEESAKICDYWKEQNHVYVNGAIRCGQDIRKLK